MSLLTMTIFRFVDNRQAIGVDTPQGTPPDAILKALNLHTSLGTRLLTQLGLLPRQKLIVLNGGTAELSPEMNTQLGEALIDGLAQVAAEENIMFITGGTNSGVFNLLGQGLQKWQHDAPCIGVFVKQLACENENTPNKAQLESHHSHFVMVDGQEWGDEREVMYSLIKYLAKYMTVLNVYAGGGELTIREMQAAVKQNCKILLLGGSGRATDQVLAAYQGQPIEDERLKDIAKHPKLYTVQLKEGVDSVKDTLRYLLYKHTQCCSGSLDK
ncbi:hypothetical protein [Candidatus Albibeggiatoa sp. nov. NOAA]|uniref:hypothetical protein n=1 Tax=Candidatus Albibeggiatoa sp. nov. NOAA TaxID=3162724 RepID=UPI0032FDBF07|nr:hypothetical protein [Thiotrichaceae bacterium]